MFRYIRKWIFLAQILKKNSYISFKKFLYFLKRKFLLYFPKRNFLLYFRKKEPCAFLEQVPKVYPEKVFYTLRNENPRAEILESFTLKTEML